MLVMDLYPLFACVHVVYVLLIIFSTQPHRPAMVLSVAAAACVVVVVVVGDALRPPLGRSLSSPFQRPNDAHHVPTSPSSLWTASTAGRTGWDNGSLVAIACRAPRGVFSFTYFAPPQLSVAWLRVVTAPPGFCRVPWHDLRVILGDWSPTSYESLFCVVAERWLNIISNRSFKSNQIKFYPALVAACHFAFLFCAVPPTAPTSGRDCALCTLRSP